MHKINVKIIVPMANAVSIKNAAARIKKTREQKTRNVGVTFEPQGFKDRR